MSIFTDVRKGHCNFHASVDQATRESTIAILRTARPVPVNIMGVCRDVKAGIKADDLPEWEDLTRLKPPFGIMWLEGEVGETCSGALLCRWELNSDGFDAELFTADTWIAAIVERNQVTRDSGHCVISFLDFLKVGGYTVCMNRSLLLIDREGRFVDSSYEKIHEEHLENWQLAWAVACAHALMRMNCANVTLVPPVRIDNGSAEKWQRILHKNPIVWHEIKITSVPKVPSIRTVTDQHTERRFHMVRGHYADYTKGNGLFGNHNLRQLFWIPEHGSGSKEVGEVVSFYSIPSQQGEGA